MPLIVYKKTTAGRRKASVIRGDTTKKKPERGLLMTKKSSGGRNAQGRMTVRHRGGGAKRRVRIIDFVRSRYDDPATVLATEYDPNRNARLSLIQYADGTKAYMIAPQDLKIGDVVVSSMTNAPIQPGNRLPLEKIPIGSAVHSVELRPGQGGKLAHGAGSGIQLMAIEGRFAQLKLPSGEIRLVPRSCSATLGTVGNADARLVRLGKAGRRRHQGFRPTVRGKAMNPVDHPHGGGEGGAPIGMKAPKTKWGRKALGIRTRNKKKWSSKHIVKRRKIKRK
jgi:large subunit ribosomal protein L2